MTIYEIDARIKELTDPETGELLDYEAFAKLNMEWTEKVENMALWCKELTAEANAIKNEIDIQVKRKQAKERRSTQLLEYISKILDGKKFETPRCVVNFRKSSALEVEDEEKLVSWAEENCFDDCVVYKTPGISKQKVTDLIKAGVVVPYAQIVQRLNVRVK